MDNWKENKKVHDEYWGKLYNYVTSNNIVSSDPKEVWRRIFKYETGNKNTFSYINRGTSKTVDFDGYTEEKNQMFQSVLNKHVTENTDAIFDLGSGWGRHSIQLAINNKNYNLLAGELSDSGRNITKYFIDNYKLNIESFQFNWLEYSSLINLLSSRNYKEIVLFSSNSIEQIPSLPTNIFKDICNVNIDKITGIHIEPIAFQYNNKPFPFNNHYNRNMKDVLEDSEDKNIIEVVNVEQQYYGHNTSLTSKNNTLIEWVKL